MEREEFIKQVEIILEAAKHDKWSDDRIAYEILNIVITMNDEMKKRMYAMPSAETIKFIDSKTGHSEELEVLTKYQVASLINCYPHTYFDEKRETWLEWRGVKIQPEFKKFVKKVF